MQNQGDSYIINLASNEYSNVISKQHLSHKMIDIVFKEKKNNKLTTIGIHAKTARGVMARFIIKNAIRHIDELKTFNDLSYAFAAELSSNSTLYFVR